MTDLHDLVAPYALDALDANEVGAFEAHLESCSECQAELLEMREGAAALAMGVAVSPPNRLKEAVMTSIDRPEAANLVQLDLRRRSRIALSVATAAAAVALVFFGLWTVASNRLTAVDHVAAVYEAPDAQLVELDTTHGPVRFVYSETLGEGVLNGARLVELSEGDVYELWLIGADGPVAAGTLQSGDSAVLVEGIASGLVFAMTVEPAPGVDAPTSDPILATEL